MDCWLEAVRLTRANLVGQTIDYLNYATGIGIRPRTPVTMCVVFFRFYGDAITGRYFMYRSRNTK